MNRPARALGLAAELSAIAFAGLLELMSPKDEVNDEAERLADLEVEQEVWDGLAAVAVKEWWLLNADCDCGLPGPHDCPIPSPDSSPAGDSSAGAGLIPPVPAPAESLAKWLTPAVLEILAEHQHLFTSETCDCGAGDHLTPLDPYSWREHVAPILAAHIAKALDARPK